MKVGGEKKKMARPQLQDDEIEAFQEELCAAAMGIIRRKGPEGLSLRELSREVGCSHVKLYRYFSSKHELLVAVRARAFMRYLRFMQEHLASVEQPLSRIRLLGMGYIDYSLRHEAEFRLMFAYPMPGMTTTSEGETTMETLHPSIRMAWEFLRHEIEGAIEAGLLVGEPVMVANVMWAGMHGVATLSLTGKLVAGAGREPLAAAMIDALLSAHMPEGQVSC